MSANISLTASRVVGKMMNLKSSYARNNLGLILTELVIEYKPRKIVEFGVLHAYSTIHMALGLQELGRGHIIACDLWHHYDYNHIMMDVAQSNIDTMKLADHITLWQGDYHTWLQNPCKFDMLHVDISNDGAIIEKTLTTLAPHMENGSIVVFEGGSKERDKVEWMKSSGKRPINPLQEKFGFEILDERFPSISIAKKR